MSDKRVNPPTQVLPDRAALDPKKMAAFEAHRDIWLPLLEAVVVADAD